MENDKSKNEDDPLGCPSLLQWFEEIEKYEADMLRGSVNGSNAVGADDLTMPFSLFPGTEGTSNPYAKQMPPTGLNLMNDLTLFSNLQNPMSDDGSVYGKGHVPIRPSDFLCCEGNTDFGYSMTPHSVFNASSRGCEIQKPCVGEELVSTIGSAAALKSIQQVGELDSNRSRPQLIDNITSIGGSTPNSWSTLDDLELVMNNNHGISGCHEDHPEKLDGSCLSLGIGRKSNGFSGRNVGYDSETAAQSNIFHSQNASRSLHHFPDVAAGFSCIQNNMPQVEEQQQFLVPGNRNFYHGVEGKCNERSIYADSNNGYQGYPAVPILPVGNSVARQPDSGLSKVNELPLSFYLNTNASLPLSDQSQKHHLESGIRNTCLQNQFGNPFTANEGTAARVAERGLFPEEFRFSQLASNPYQPEVVSAVPSSAYLPGSVISGHEIPTTIVNRAVQPPRAFVGTSVKGGAAEISAVTSQAQPTFSREEITATNVNSTSHHLRTSVGTSIKRGAAETFTAASHTEPTKARRTQSSGVSAEAPSHEVSSLQILSHDASFSSRDRTSQSLLHQAKSTTLNRPQSQTRSDLPPRVKGLPSVTRTAPSVPLEAKSAPLLPPFLQSASALPPQGRSIPSVPWLSQTSPSLPLQAKSTPLLPWSQTTSLIPQVKGNSSLPSLSQTAPIQTQARSIPSLTPTTSSIKPTKARRNALLRCLSQTAHALQPQATSSLPFPYVTVPSLLPIANSTPAPTLSQNGPSFPPQPQNASPLPSTNRSGQPLLPKSLRGSPLPQKPRTALPARSHIASSISSKFSAPHLLPTQPPTASLVTLKNSAPHFSPTPQTTPAVTQKVNVPRLPPQRQTDPVLHIKWNAADETQLTGHKCLICKRDLAFTPEGPVSMPPIAPMVAVLPCGHTFHDHCLQVITPQDDLKSPPCIPCAIGES